MKTHVAHLGKTTLVRTPSCCGRREHARLRRTAKRQRRTASPEPTGCQHQMCLESKQVLTQHENSSTEAHRRAEVPSAVPQDWLQPRGGQPSLPAPRQSSQPNCAPRVRQAADSTVLDETLFLARRGLPVPVSWSSYARRPYPIYPNSCKPAHPVCFAPNHEFPYATSDPLSYSTPVSVTVL